MAQIGESGINPAAIERIARLIRPHVRRTPVMDLRADDCNIGDAAITLKLEHMQHAGSFKTRGAFANLLTHHAPPAGVVAASGGNHGAAVAYAAMRLGIRARIFVPSISSTSKVDRIRQYGAELEIGGDRYADALAASERWIAKTGALAVHAFDQIETLLGQATLGTELTEQSPNLDTLLVAVGGGGLIGGIAGWYRGRVRLVAVEPEGAPTLTAALAAGRPVDAPTGSVAADSLAPRRVGELMFPLACAFVDRVALVSDDAILHAQEELWRRFRVVAEPGGAAPFAALLSAAYRPADGERVGVVISGGNTSAVDFSRQGVALS
jgi:threonine dehydratase